MKRHFYYLFFLFHLCSFQAKGETEVEALLKWKSSLYDPIALNSWSLSNSTKPCNWYGIICDSNNTVTKLNLPNTGVNGTINNLDLISLPNLTHLNFSGNHLLHGTIPESFSYLTNLVSLDLSGNGLTGSIPQSIGALTRLKYLNLGMNGLTGTIPEGIGNLVNLVELNLVYNYFNGTIPEFIGKLTQLNVLHLGSNNLTGRIPSELADLGFLRVLNLSTNSLFVPIPSFIANFSKLESLDLSGLNLHGQLRQLFIGNDGTHSWNFSSLPNLQYLFIRDNFLNGSLPSFFCKLDALIALDLSSNQLSGELPQCWWEIKNLEMMILESNNFSGEIPISTGHMPPLLSIHLENNSLVGWFPSALKYCRDLVVLDLGKNRLYGEIPEWLGYSFPSLKILSLRSNMFNGTIPVLENLGKLQLMDLSSNNFSGSIPQSIGNLTSMTVQQTWNKLDSSKFTYMESISITWKGSELSFQQNLALVNGIDLSSNSLTGEIPTELTRLFGLLFLNLSNNHFTHTIPERIGDLQALEFLDLSNNELSGPIPPSIASITSLSFLNLSNNNLSGKIPMGSQMQTLDNPQIYAGNDGLCGFPLEACKTSNSTDQNGSMIDENEDTDNREIVWLFGFVMFGFILGIWTFFGTLLFKKYWRIWYFHKIDRMQEVLDDTLKSISAARSYSSMRVLIY
ncbi:putative leucine-rich repeat receptor-like protein kinase [Carex littledalei]|uniref:Putative leucine-rich repeat receptor-like protein kinase n=1 Tax=Carex littledalei TaxID=544730 RepID=A0A833R1C1_9POAL|nr:putative leucine-rich repeat receptor-like protein kinase [Carex littledalei]